MTRFWASTIYIIGTTRNAIKSFNMSLSKYRYRHHITYHLLISNTNQSLVDYLNTEISQLLICHPNDSISEVTSRDRYRVLSHAHQSRRCRTKQWVASCNRKSRSLTSECYPYAFWLVESLGRCNIGNIIVQLELK